MIGAEQNWLYAAIDVGTKLLLDAPISDRRETDPAAEKHDLPGRRFLVDGMGYPTALARCDPRGHLDPIDRGSTGNYSIAYDSIRSISTDMDSSVNQRPAPFTAFAYCYNAQRPNQALDNHAPVEKTTKR
jgi:transposase-like protein